MDERSSAFFALGIAKKSNSPVLIVTTSGTAVAELYPAIIEAYYQRVPLIVCTADRPSFLKNSGANQTINQHNIYRNHIRFFTDAGLPGIGRLKTISSIAEKAIQIACYSDRGPVHINLPFEKPFEPKSYTDKIDVSVLENKYSKKSTEFKTVKTSKVNFEQLGKKFSQIDRGLILIGSNNYPKNFGKAVTGFAKKFCYPIYVDGSSTLRFGSHPKKIIIDNFTAFVRAGNFTKVLDPDLIIQFGGSPTSNVLLEFFKNSKAEKILVNEFGDRNDPSFTSNKIITYNPKEFCNSFINLPGKKKSKASLWLQHFIRMNNEVAKIKTSMIEETSFPFEGAAASKLFKYLPDNSNIMVSNSLSIRDVDFSSCRRPRIFPRQQRSSQFSQIQYSFESYFNQ